jgi:hypothetical protein
VVVRHHHNFKNLIKAFTDLDYGDYDSIETMEFILDWQSFYAAGIELDILPKLKSCKCQVLMHSCKLLLMGTLTV